MRHSADRLFRAILADVVAAEINQRKHLCLTLKPLQLEGENEMLDMNPTQEAEKKNSTKENNPHLKLDIKTDGV